MTTGGDKFKQAIEQALERAQEFENKTIRVGIVEEQHYPSGESVAQVAYFQEYGTATIPPRPFFRTTQEEKSKDWADIARKGLSESLRGGREPEAVLSIIGMKAAADIQGKISQITDPPLKASTIKARNAKYASKSSSKSSKPLVDSGLMHASIKYKIVNSNK